ncbi:ketopantoate reductase family protein [Salinithrix halophila]|uniref:2-dehydropantoate 2-reductase n=1 Tax=Salinithrix halophila TaxID=1485204 RepID=A0ABV8JE03_9BACL
MKIAVWGAGAIGLLWGARLVLAGEDVFLVTRTRKQRDELNRNGINLTEPSGASCCISVRAVWAGEKMPPFDLVLLTVKQTALPPLVPLLAQRCRQGASLLLMQNGMGQEDLLKAEAPGDHIYRAVTTEGALREGTVGVIHTGMGETHIGPIEGGGETRVIRWIRGISHQGLPVAFNSGIDRLTWQKLAINCVINPLTSLFRVKNGGLLAFDFFPYWVDSILEEVVRTAEETGIHLSREELKEKVYHICARTADNRSSMLEDLSRGKPTEISFINGFIVRQGKQSGVKTPMNGLLYDLVRTAEGSHGEAEVSTRE